MTKSCSIWYIPLLTLFSTFQQQLLGNKTTITNTKKKILLHNTQKHLFKDEQYINYKMYATYLQQFNLLNVNMVALNPSSAHVHLLIQTTQNERPISNYQPFSLEYIPIKDKIGFGGVFQASMCKTYCNSSWQSQIQVFIYLNFKDKKFNLSVLYDLSN